MVDGDLPTRLHRLIDEILSRHEKREFNETHAADSVPVRVKALRRHYLERMCDEKLDEAFLKGARAAREISEANVTSGRREANQRSSCRVRTGIRNPR